MVRAIGSTNVVFEMLAVLRIPLPVVCLCWLGVAGVITTVSVGLAAEKSVPGKTAPGTSFDSLVAQLDSTYFLVRADAVTALGRSSDPRAFDHLMGALKDIRPEVRKAALIALANFGDPRALPAMSAFVVDKNVETGVAAVSAIGRMKHPSAIPYLVDAIRHKHYSVRGAAYNTLKTVGSAAVPALIAELKKNNRSARLKLITLLGEIGDPRAVGILETYASSKDGNQAINSRASKALAAIGDARTINGLLAALNSGDGGARYEAASALMTVGPPAVPGLIRVLNTGDWPAQREAVVALGEIRDPRAVAPLIAVVEEHRTLLMSDALQALGKLKDRRAVPPLTSLLANSKARSFAGGAIGALGNIGDKSATPHIVNFLRDRRIGAIASNALAKLEWQPGTDTERVYYLIGLKASERLTGKDFWPVVRNVLIRDIQSSDYEVFAYALYSFIALGADDVMPVLLNKLASDGNKEMANAYLNSGHPELSKAGADWARSHGYIVNTVSRSNATVRWGSF